MQHLQITAMEKYVTKEDLKDQFDRIVIQFDKLESKMDTVFMVEHDKNLLLRHYKKTTEEQL